MSSSFRQWTYSITSPNKVVQPPVQVTVYMNELTVKCPLSFLCNCNVCFQEILPNNVVKLDNNFKHSFIHDLLTVRLCAFALYNL